ncbi:serine/threonine protein kinase [Actinomycetospora endophytica]|uniref:non-specific serine/threonine protein kinase n=1 Tax=Actinomycetospora endophytica TaxID=2291215 RepID=A0ABS8P9L7_9PSEU|nr:serine/threonine-protein kinase [Actinomycetospora endophytica]MCD2194961.1 serine/threonine protein kinase [Actinomycetospora endophytica]
MEHQDRTDRVVAPPGGQPSTLHDREPAVPDPAVGGTLLGGRYRVGECIGTGAMGVVWTAWDRRLARTVAVKQLALPRDGDPVEVRTARTRALREGRIAARVVHSRAIAVFDVVTQDSMPWLVMEYLPSRSLATVLAARGPLPPGEVARIGAQIADALSAVHEAGIVHGDVKPGNVLLTDDGVAKLTDFGVSRASWDTTATGGGVVAGTPGYFAPEVARGGDPTPASDVFSLGATLYAAVENELVCGPMDNTLGVLHAMAEGRLRPAQRAGVLGRPLSAMLRLDPAHRPDTALLRTALATRAAREPDPSSTPVAAPPPVDPAADAGTPDDGAGTPSADEPAQPPVPGPPTAPAIGMSTPGEPDDPADPADSDDEALAARPSRTGPPTTPARAVRPFAGRRRVLAVAAASAVVLSAGVGAAVAAVGPTRSDHPGAQAAAPHALAPTTAPALTVPPAAAPDTVPPAAGAPLSPDSPAAPAPAGLQGNPGDPVSSDDVRMTVSDYYASLPGDIPGAWSYLSGDAQNASGGFGGYQSFWSSISSVSADDVQVDGTSARAQLEFVTADGRTSRETYHFEVDRNDQGRLEIQSAARGGADSA